MKIIVGMPFSMEHESVLELLESHCMLCHLDSSHKSAVALSSTAARKLLAIFCSHITPAFLALILRATC